MKLPERLTRLFRNACLSGSCLVLALPASTNYKLDAYTVGGGGTDRSSSTQYLLNAEVGGTATGEQSGGSAKIRSGLNPMQEAGVPAAPTLENQNDNYDRLHFVLDPGDNPSDTTYAIAVSADDFATTKYVQADNTLGNSLTAANRQTYAQWGGAGGGNVLGLWPGTTYKMKVKAMQGDFSETDFGPAASATTSIPKLDFAISTDSQPFPPFVIQFDDLMAGQVTDAPDKIWVDYGTNANLGGRVYVISLFNGLYSPKTNYTITSSSGDLAGKTEGFGGQGGSVSQASGGPFRIVAPYNGSGQTIGIIDQSIRELFATDLPVSGARGAVSLKAKSSYTTPAASDYTTVLTLLASAVF